MGCAGVLRNGEDPEMGVLGVRLRAGMMGMRVRMTLVVVEFRSCGEGDGG